MVVSTNDGPAYLLHNETATQNHWLTLLLVGHTSNRDAIGAEVKLTSAGRSQWATVSTASSYLSASDKRIHFGLSSGAEAEVEIRWPSGIRQTLLGLKADRQVIIEEPGTPGSKPVSKN